MKVTKNMFDKGLQSRYLLMKICDFFVVRRWGIRLINFLGTFLNERNVKGLNCEEKYIPSKSGGPDIRIRIFRPLNQTEKLPAMLYNHGGGFIIGNPEASMDIYKKYINKRPCVIIAPDYRKALKHPYPAGFNDCYDTLLWMKENAEKLNIHADQFIVAGHSAGGGLTAAVTLKARDTQDVNIAFQMPIYPMLDDRHNTESSKNIIAPVWNTKSNKFAWRLYLKNTNENKPPHYAAPGRNKDYKNFPPTITFVGEYEPFRDETIDYIERLKKAGIPTEFKFYKACYHAFEIVAPKSLIAKDADHFLYGKYAEYYDKYVIV